MRARRPRSAVWPHLWVWMGILHLSCAAFMHGSRCIFPARRIRSSKTNPYGVLTYGDAASLSTSACAVLVRALDRLSETNRLVSLRRVAGALHRRPRAR